MKSPASIYPYLNEVTSLIRGESNEKLSLQGDVKFSNGSNDVTFM